MVGRLSVVPATHDANTLATLAGGNELWGLMNAEFVIEDDEFPVYLLVDPKLDEQFGLPGGIPRINPPGMKPLLAVFTDEDLAKRFCEDLRRPDVIPHAIRSPKELLTIAEFFQNSGIQEVARDLCFHPPTIQTTNMVSFITALRRSAGI